MSYQQSEYMHDDPSMDVDSLPSLDGSNSNPPHRRSARFQPGPAARVIEHRVDGSCALLRPYILPACLVTALLIILSFARFTESTGPHVDHFGVQPSFEHAAAPRVPLRQQKHQRKSVGTILDVSCVGRTACSDVRIGAHQLVATKQKQSGQGLLEVSALGATDLLLDSTTDIQQDRQCIMDFAFYSKDKQLHTRGTASFYNEGQQHLLAVTTRENGRGRAVVMRKVLRIEGEHSDVLPASSRCLWSTLHFFPTPDDAEFKDFSAIALSPVNAIESHRQRVAISSSSSSKVWIGELDIQRWTWSSGQVYNLPADAQCNTRSCTLESLQWLSDDMLAYISFESQIEERTSRRVQILVVT